MKLKSSYTTGVHTVATIKALLSKNYKSVKIKLPTKKIANIKINNFLKTKNFIKVTSIKGLNDDLDVTKGCKIETFLVKKIKKNFLNKIKHNPVIIKINSNKIYLYAGIGVGVVTKKGLKIDVGYPAINPIPLKILRNEAKKVLKTNHKKFHFIISVKNGEKLAKNTANSKVGVLGGLSILGTSGIVKPISNEAYLSSIETEIKVANANCKKIIFTLGNLAFNFAKAQNREICVVEIGNFIFNSFEFLKKCNFEEVIFIASLGKMTKVAQGFKNTHNRFGEIDFNLLKLWIKEEFKIELNHKFNTTKELINELYKLNLSEKLYLLIIQKAIEVLSGWSEFSANLKVICLEEKKEATLSFSLEKLKQ